MRTTPGKAPRSKIKPATALLTAMLLTCSAAPAPSSTPPAARDGKDDGAEQQEIREELARLQGVWWLSTMEVNGKKAPDDQVRSWQLVIEGDQYNPGSGETSVEYSFRIDPSRNPKAIDLLPHEGQNKGRTLRGVYALKGKLLMLCRSLGSDGERPAGFRTRPDSGLASVVWSREKP